MKQLKFVPNLVPLILDHTKTATWRLWDDKDIQVGDGLELINRKDMKPFALAKVIRVVEKPFGELTDVDKDGHESFDNDQEMYDTFALFYDHEVNADTVVKIIHFQLEEK